MTTNSDMNARIEQLYTHSVEAWGYTNDGVAFPFGASRSQRVG